MEDFLVKENSSERIFVITVLEMERVITDKPAKLRHQNGRQPDTAGVTKPVLRLDFGDGMPVDHGHVEMRLLLDEMVEELFSYISRIRWLLIL